MAVNLKPVYDAAKAADEKVSAIMAEMSAAFEEGTEEGKQKALAMREQLDAARLDAKQTNELYVAMRDAGADSDQHARMFVPVNDAVAKASSESGKKMGRSEWLALSFEERRLFFKDGGTLVPDEVE